MLSKEQLISEALDRSLSDLNDKYKKYLMGQPTIKFAAEFMLQNELPEMVMPISNTAQSSVSYAFLLATNERVFCAGGVGGGLFEAPKPDYREFSYSSIATIQFEKGNLLKNAKITFHISTTSATGRVAKMLFESTRTNEDLGRFVDCIRSKIAGLNSPSGKTDAQQVTENGDIVEKLERLGQLKTQGIITDDEFLVAKKKLLGL